MQWQVSMVLLPRKSYVNWRWVPRVQTACACDGAVGAAQSMAQVTARACEHRVTAVSACASVMAEQNAKVKVVVKMTVHVQAMLAAIAMLLPASMSTAALWQVELVKVQCVVQQWKVVMMEVS